MIKKILVLLSMVLFHAACSGNNQHPAAVPHAYVAAYGYGNGYSGGSYVYSGGAPGGPGYDSTQAYNCPQGTQPFVGGQQVGSSDDVVCLDPSVFQDYQPMYRHLRGHEHDNVPGPGALCRDERDDSCGNRGQCQPLQDRDYGFCRLR